MPNPDPNARFAIIELLPDERQPLGCIAWGSMSAIMLNVRDSKAQRADALLVAKADAARRDLDRIRSDAAQLDFEALRTALERIALLEQTEVATCGATCRQAFFRRRRRSDDVESIRLPRAAG